MRFGRTSSPTFNGSNNVGTDKPSSRNALGSSDERAPTNDSTTVEHSLADLEGCVISTRPQRRTITSQILEGTVISTERSSNDHPRRILEGCVISTGAQRRGETCISNRQCSLGLPWGICSSPHHNLRKIRDPRKVLHRPAH